MNKVLMYKLQQRYASVIIVIRHGHMPEEEAIFKELMQLPNAKYIATRRQIHCYNGCRVLFIMDNINYDRLAGIEINGAFCTADSCIPWELEQFLISRQRYGNEPAVIRLEEDACE